MKRFNFIKENLKTNILASIITILPIFVGIILWNKLPDMVATHWGPQGVPDGYSSKAFAVFAMPAFMLIFHWLCMFISCLDKRMENQTQKALKLVFWLCPVLSLLASFITYSTALGFGFNIAKISVILMGVLFIVIGNYLPKTTQNFHLGIRLPWTLKSEKNWNMTHRFAGKLWLIGGIASLLLSLTPVKVCFIIFAVDLLLMVIVPTLYSYIIYKREK